MDGWLNQPRTCRALYGIEPSTSGCKSGELATTLSLYVVWCTVKSLELIGILGVNRNYSLTYLLTYFHADRCVKSVYATACLSVLLQRVSRELDRNALHLTRDAQKHALQHQQQQQQQQAADVNNLSGFIASVAQV